MRRWGWILAALAACGDPEPSAEVEPERDDLDGDGAPEGLDCDDLDPARSPGAVELCDGLDNDCDGLIDEDGAVGALRWYLDADRDGVGVASDRPPIGCTAPPDGHYAARAGDCDDRDATTYPGAPERCGDGVDNDCDGLSDSVDPDPDPATAGSWARDRDGDGWGNPATLLRACARPPADADGDWAARIGDCDDGDPDAFPGATPGDGGAAACTRDADGDGFGDQFPGDGIRPGSDCDDARAFRYPGAPERCEGLDTDCDGRVPAVEQDRDGDRAVACTIAPGAWSGDPAVIQGGDCDESDPEIGPGRPERCGGGDEDCDGVVDESDAIDALDHHPDSDGDGFGDPAGAPVRACAAPAGTVRLRVGGPVDCDDTDPAVYPGGSERCGGGDEDCDGLVDESDAVDARPWPLDGDGDGVGRAGLALLGCSAPPGTAASAGDCDDGDAAIFPGAEEVCDAIDNNCDGTVDDADPLVRGDVWYLDRDQDGVGDTARVQRQCAAPTGHVRVGGDCDDRDETAFPGAAEVCRDGVDNDCDGGPGACTFAGASALAAAELRAEGATAGLRLGASAAVGDIDGDGAADLLVGATGDRSAGVDAGALWVQRGPVRVDGTLSAPDLRLTGPAAFARAGAAVLAPGDLNEDTIGDLVVGACPVLASEAGAIWVLAGPVTASGGLGALGEGFDGAAAGDGFGCALARGDFDADGRVDVAVGAPGVDGVGVDAGAVLLFRGVPAGQPFAAPVAPGWAGAAGRAEAGAALLGVDLDGDDATDLVVGAPGTDGSRGALGVLYGPIDPTGDLGAAPTRIRGASGGDRFAGALAAADLDGDGLPELMVGGPGHAAGGAGAGAVWVFDAPALGSGSFGANGAARLRLDGSVGDGAGSALWAGDEAALPGLVVAAPGASPAGSAVGVLYLLDALGAGVSSLSAAATGATWGRSVGDLEGVAIGGPGDLDGDGLIDLLIGTPALDQPALGLSDSGAAFGLLGLTW